MPLQSPLLEGKRRKRTCEQVVGPQLGAKGLGPGKIPFGKPTWSAQSLSQIILVSFHSSVAYPGVSPRVPPSSLHPPEVALPSGSLSGPWGISSRA